MDNATYAQCETVAAIVGEFFYDHAKYDKFYSNHCDAISGTPGVLRYLIEASEVFEHASKAFDVCGKEYDWIAAVEHFVHNLPATELLSESDLRLHAANALQNSLL